MIVERGQAMLTEAVQAVGDGPGLDALRARLEQGVRQLGQPMRLAVVGQIKKGKSTLVNAFLGRELVSTGLIELTFNVNELVWADDHRIRVHFKDGRHPEERSTDELAALTERNEANNEFLRSIRVVEFGSPNELLDEFILVDTPGLDSVFGEDSENTMAYLNEIGKDAGDIERDSTEAMSGADAIVYVFTRGLNKASVDLIANFGGASERTTSPLRAVAALNKCELLWHPFDRPDPLAEGRRVIDANREEHPVLRRLFYAIEPVCALVGSGAGALTDDDLQVLADLAATDPEKLATRASNVKRFSEKEYDDLPVPAARRRALIERLSGYGIHVACELIREGVPPGQELRTELFERSNVKRLRDLCVSHFGNRAAIIKLDRALSDVMAEVWAARRAKVADGNVLDSVGTLVERFSTNETGFAELGALAAHYNRELSFTEDEAADLESVTGERGRGCGSRVGLTDESPIDQIVSTAEEKVRYWSRRANDPLIDRKTEPAARTVHRSFEHVAYHAREAKRHLDLEV